MEQAREILSMKNITKVYGNGVLANSHVDFSVNRGEIHALMGENGAGKSTLMKILFGIEQPDEGTIELDGKTVKIASSDDALRLGIGMVHQHFKLVSSLTVAENIVLGKEPKKNGFLDRKKAVEITRALSERFRFDVDPTAAVSDLSVGKKQKVEILKALYREVKLLILDEPTAVLTPQETEELFEQLLNLKKEGYTIIFISHKLNEVKYLCDRLTVLKDGRSIGTYNLADITLEEISRLMVGRDVKLEYDKTSQEFGEKILKVENLNYTDKFGTKKLDNLSFSLKAGEVLGIAGIEGNGQKEAMEILTGNRKAESGSVFYKGKDLTKLSITDNRKLGIAHVPEDRNLNGCAPEMSVRDNLIATSLKRLSGKGSILKPKEIESYCDKCVEDFTVKTMNLDISIKSLSGGNVQKAIVAREFTAGAEIIVLNQPTRGVDVGAMEFIHKKILEMRDEKKSLILVSADLTELRALSDRIIVFHQGKVAGVINDVPAATEEELGLYMLGLKEDPAEKLQEA